MAPSCLVLWTIGGCDRVTGQEAKQERERLRNEGERRPNTSLWRNRGPRRHRGGGEMDHGRFGGSALVGLALEVEIVEKEQTTSLSRQRHLDPPRLFQRLLVRVHRFPGLHTTRSAGRSVRGHGWEPFTQPHDAGDAGDGSL
ncbi:hypothetical protein DM02DRAFT_631021 [Periconia macrospinosa]|uniref:Uncharacterized protein n=1 Tax=Periconia macrospinosa TaxID=97972 RepID=A0A2V1DJZ1_9PLEO|nr:hypothetical protein DM02DRAFT_631021 [Periconia macrospinosa]